MDKWEKIIQEQWQELDNEIQSQWQQWDNNIQDQWQEIESEDAGNEKLND